MYASTNRNNIWKELEQGFGTSKIRIIKHLILNPQKTFTKYALVKATGLRTSSVQKHLIILLRIGWIRKHSFKPISYEANLQNRIVKEIHNLFQDVRTITR